tara:strand:+ start:189 stop:1085 length:897 start_codon:yes stop_codon:yes gene_type:complete
MARGKVLNKNPQEGDIKIIPSSNTKWMYTNGKWVYIKKPKKDVDVELIRTLFVEGKTFDEITKLVKCSKNTVVKYCQGLKVKFPPVNLPDHIKPTKYPHYYVSNDGIAYRKPRNIDAYGRFGEVNEYGLIELTTTLRGNPNYGEEFMYEGTNIYFYDEDGKNIGYKKRNIHQLVAETWIPNPHGYKEVLHGDKGNRCNHYTNLRWGTHKENMKEAKSAAPEGTIREHLRYYGRASTKYIKKNGEWVLIPSNRPPWNKGMKSGLPDGTIRKQSNGHYKIKTNGDWVHLPKKDYINLTIG